MLNKFKKSDFMVKYYKVKNKLLGRKELYLGEIGHKRNIISKEDKNKLEEYISNLHENCDYIENIIVLHNNDYKENCIINIDGKTINLTDCYFDGVEIEEGIINELCAWYNNELFERLDSKEEKPLFCIDKIDYTRFLELKGECE